jgi:hypothetical protein
MLEGMVLLRLLYPNRASTSDVACPIVEGMLPVNKFLCKLTNPIDGNPKIPVGMVPTNLLLPRPRDCNEVIETIVDGMEPDI